MAVFVLLKNVSIWKDNMAAMYSDQKPVVGHSNGAEYKTVINA